MNQIKTILDVYHEYYYGKEPNMKYNYESNVFGDIVKTRFIFTIHMLLMKCLIMIKKNGVAPK